MDLLHRDPYDISGNNRQEGFKSPGDVFKYQMLGRVGH